MEKYYWVRHKERKEEPFIARDDEKNGQIWSRCGWDDFYYFYELDILQEIPPYEA